MRGGPRGPEFEKLGLHWVGDLMLKCDVEVKSPQGESLLDLVEGGQHFGCRIDVATGIATLSIEGEDEFAPTAVTDVRGPGSYQLALANVDGQLLLWVNDSRTGNFDPDHRSSGSRTPGNHRSQLRDSRGPGIVSWPATRGAAESRGPPILLW